MKVEGEALGELWIALKMLVDVWLASIYICCARVERGKRFKIGKSKHGWCWTEREREVAL